VTNYEVYGDDRRDTLEHFAKFKEELDESATAWSKFNSQSVYIRSRLDWDTMREFFADIGIVSVALSVEVPKACLVSES
jgi:hypothetical protein